MRRAIFVALWSVVCPVLFAAEMPPENMAEILEHARTGELVGLWETEQIVRFAPDHIWRVRCTMLEQAQFTVAELEIKAGRPAKAVEVLQKLVASTKNADVTSAATYNLGRTYARKLNNLDKAIETLKTVTGRFAPMARRDIVVLAEGQGRIGKAIEFLQAAAADAKNKGEKLALLRRLGKLCERKGRVEDALAAYRQITEQFTPEDIEALKTAAVKRAKEAMRKVLKLREQERWREAENEHRKMRMWVLQLRASGREDELKAATETVETAKRKAEEKKREEDRPRERDKPQEKQADE